jgi:hypothetical protein
MTPMQQIALAFSDILARDLTGAQMDAVNASNFPDGDARADGACASHDYIDANMAMLEAFESVQPFDRTDARDCELWADAWSLAKACEFSESSIRNYFKR